MGRAVTLAAASMGCREGVVDVMWALGKPSRYDCQGRTYIGMRIAHPRARFSFKASSPLQRRKSGVGRGPVGTAQQFMRLVPEAADFFPLFDFRLGQGRRLSAADLH